MANQYIVLALSLNTTMTNIDDVFTTMPTLTTKRLAIKPIRIDDAEGMFQIKSLPEVTYGYGQEPHRSLEDTKKWILRCLDDHMNRLAIVWVITKKNEIEIIGSCCFWNFGPGMKCAELGYELHPSSWHQGIMSEAAKEVVRFGFEDLGLHRIEADPLSINGPSQNVLVKLGFKLEGTLRERQLFHGRYLDQLYFGMLKEEWTGLDTELNDHGPRP